MTDAPSPVLSAPDLSACRLWRPSAALGAAWIGIIPAWNAVTLLNPSAAAIWDLLIETGDLAATIRAYAHRRPDRAAMAGADVAACLAAWAAQGMFDPPAPSDEARQLAALPSVPAPRPARPALRRTLLVAGRPMVLEIDDPTLAAVVADLTVDFPATDRAAEHVLTSTGPEGGWLLHLDGQPIRWAPHLPMARGQIVAELVRLAGGDRGWRATVHGAVLAGPSGAVFLAGESGAGKSTLSAGLVARGWTILAEDIAAFGEDWRVHPLPFALSIKDGAVAALAQDFPALPGARIHQLGPRRVRYQGLPAAARATRAETPRLILDVQYTAAMGDAPAALEPLTEIEALGLFMNEESYIGFDRDDTGDFLDFIARTPACRLRYGDIAAAERGIRARLHAHRAGPAE
ncbi:MAG: hypothetical protein R3D80_03665 [Paracoccaceae bacterium]